MLKERCLTEKKYPHTVGKEFYQLAKCIVRIWYTPTEFFEEQYIFPEKKISQLMLAEVNAGF